MIKTLNLCEFPPPSSSPQVSCDLLHSDTAVEPALEGKIALAEALARQWFGIILQPRWGGLTYHLSLSAM